MFPNLVFVGLAMMLGGGRVWEVPFYEGCTGNVWDVMQVDYLEVQIKLWLYATVSFSVLLGQDVSYSAVLGH